MRDIGRLHGAFISAGQVQPRVIQSLAMRPQVDTKAVISSERISQLAFDQLELVVKSMTAREWARPVIGIALTLTFSRWIALPQLALWLALVFVGGIPATLMDRRFLTRPASCTRSAAQWQWTFCLAHAPCAAAWASLAYFLWLPGNDLNHYIIIMALGCSVSAVGPLFGSCRPLSLSVFVIFGSVFLGTTLLAGTSDDHALAIVILAYLALLFLILRQVHTTVSNTLILKYENSDLLAQQCSLIEAKNVLISDKNVLIRDLAATRLIAEQKCEEAELASQFKSQFLANMSHELRTPLNAIIGFSEIIKSRILGDDINRNIEYARLIHGSGVHLLTLINDILDIAKIESGSLELNEQEVALDSVIAEAVALLQDRAQEGGCTLICAVDAAVPAVRADRRALKQVLLNLLSNALKFTLPGGTVTAFARQVTDGHIAFGVADTGVGIASEDQAKVFVKFGQGRHAHRPKEGGTGLGLSIAQGLIHAHGGEIALESVEHEGTTVTIMLPASRTIPAQPHLLRSCHHL
jgi:two-component system, cell cycle sensor histidine kinase PleC